MTDPLASLDGRITDIRAKAEQVKESFNAARNVINADPNLSDQGRQSQLDTVKQQHREQAKALRAEENAAVANHVGYLERSLFGTAKPDEVVSFRDAQDRAERLDDPDAASTLLARAERSNDQILARAIVRVAAEQQWTSVLREYEASHPGTGENLSALARLRKFSSGGFDQTLTYAVI